MNRVVQDHIVSGYVSKVLYRAIKEPDQELDYSIRYYPGPGAKESNARIQTFLGEKRKPRQFAGRLQPQDVLETAERAIEVATFDLITQEQIETERLVFELFSRFGISAFKS